MEECWLKSVISQGQPDLVSSCAQLHMFMRAAVRPQALPSFLWNLSPLTFGGHPRRIKRNASSSFAVSDCHCQEDFSLVSAEMTCFIRKQVLNVTSHQAATLHTKNSFQHRQFEYIWNLCLYALTRPKRHCEGRTASEITTVACGWQGM